MELKFEYNSDILKFRVQYNFLQNKCDLFPYFVDIFVTKLSQWWENTVVVLY